MSVCSRLFVFYAYMSQKGFLSMPTGIYLHTESAWLMEKVDQNSKFEFGSLRKPQLIYLSMFRIKKISSSHVHKAVEGKGHCVSLHQLPW